MFIDAPTLSAFVKDNLAHAIGNDLRQHWDSIIAQALLESYGEILSAFAERGFLQAQVDAWDRGIEFQKSLGAWFALRRMQILQGDAYSDKALTILDRRIDLRGDKTKDWTAVALTINGVAQYPNGTYGLPAVGPIDTTNDMFVMPTKQQDSRIGCTTRL